MQIFNRSRSPHAQGDQDEAAARPQRRLRVLLIDENATARAVVARRLSHLNYDVALAENGLVARTILVTRPVDIILIDMAVTMPGAMPETMRGAVATMQNIRAAGLAANACFVMITGRPDSQSAVEALDGGADDHIAKPFDFDVLDARLRHLCARADHMDILARHNAELDARIARRALELGETRDTLRAMQADRARLVSSIQALHDELGRLNEARG